MKYIEKFIDLSCITTRWNYILTTQNNIYNIIYDISKYTNLKNTNKSYTSYSSSHPISQRYKIGGF